MFYKVKVKDYIRLPPEKFSDDMNQGIVSEIKKKYAGYISKNLNMVVDVLSVEKVEEGVLIPGDGATYYDTTFYLLCFEPELHEVVYGRIKDIADFGAFIGIGPIDGMIHISQTMNDFVSFSKDKTLQGKDTKRLLRVNDRCVARIIAVSYKDIANPKLGLTMRQPGLGREDWIEEDLKKQGL